MNRGAYKRLIGMFNVTIDVPAEVGYVTILATLLLAHWSDRLGLHCGRRDSHSMMVSAGYDRDKSAGLVAGTNLVVPSCLLIPIIVTVRRLVFLSMGYSGYFPTFYHGPHCRCSFCVP